MEKRIILRGALWGGLGGILAFVFARIFAEPIIARAIDYEGARDEAQEYLEHHAGGHAMADGVEIFSRSIQSNVGIGVGMIAFGAAMGALFAVVYCVVYNRFPTLSPGTLAIRLAAAMFFALYFVPFLKYPANPPSIGHGDTIGARTGLYLTMVVVSVLTLVFAIWLSGKLQVKVGTYGATLLAGGAFVVIIAADMLLLPSLGHLSVNLAQYGDNATETPQPLYDAAGKIVFPGFSADDLYYFRLYSITSQLILWATIGLGFAPAANKLLGAPESSVRVSA
ncbi:cobalt transporter [Mycolicibacterium sp. CH28]|uniref:CbtA family protein n=1 Tax=Mycolicibacterium sp. CH28 TaxID=2512237 RepID=UPI0010809851|nr:CbtA family protein [Mycolicibacterium sp. CH28]TGD86135.1 cobalt transporter [Mycolicibacterium sp. CH28]